MTLDGPPPLGIMLYGYGRDEARLIGDSVSGSSGSAVEVIDASGMEDAVVSSILEGGGSGSFVENDVRVLMFLGFDDDTLGRAMDDLRGVRGIVRPIFCCLTEENVNWTMKELLRDLMEEDRYFKEKDARSKGSSI